MGLEEGMNIVIKKRIVVGGIVGFGERERLFIKSNVSGDDYAVG